MYRHIQSSLIHAGKNLVIHKSFLFLTCWGYKSIEPPISRFFSSHWHLTPHKWLRLVIFHSAARRHKEGNGKPEDSSPANILISFTFFALLFYYFGHKSRYTQSWLKSILIHLWTWTRLYNLSLLTCFRGTRNFKVVGIIFSLYLSGLLSCLSVFLTEHHPNGPCNIAIWVWVWGPLLNCNFLWEDY